MNDDGTFGQVLSYNLGGMATATPLVYKGRIYIGVCGQGGQFNADGGHHFDVIAESDNELKLAYSVSVPGYPQAARFCQRHMKKKILTGTESRMAGFMFILLPMPFQVEFIF